jgi:hypothetical protein
MIALLIGGSSIPVGSFCKSPAISSTGTDHLQLGQEAAVIGPAPCAIEIIGCKPGGSIDQCQCSQNCNR